MNQLFYDGEIVGAKKVRRFTRYNIGDIIVFKRSDGTIIIHMIENHIFDAKGNEFFITIGLNPDTNQKVDSELVSKNDIIGKVCLSKKKTLRLMELVKQGKITAREAFGMPNNPSIDKWKSDTYATDERLQMLKDIEGKIIQKMDDAGKNVIHEMPVKFNIDEVLGVIRKHGTKQVMWIELGYYDSIEDKGVGMLKIDGKHYENQFEDWGVDWNTPQKRIDNILEILETQEEIDYKFTIEQGHTYLYELRIKEEVQYLLIGIGTNGFIITAHRFGQNKIKKE